MRFLAPKFRHTVFLILAASALQSGGVAVASHKEKCVKALGGLVSRALISVETIEELLSHVTNDSLIMELETEHLLAMRNTPGNGAKTWKKFHPTWILESEETLERVLNYFDPNDHSNPKYPGGIKAWVDEWEQVYTSQLGEASEKWKNGGKRRFVQKLLVEAAVRFAIREGMGKKPTLFLTQPSETAPLVNELAAQIQDVFRSDELEFQKLFLETYRRREKLGLGVGRLNVPIAEAEIRQQLNRAGVDLKQLRDWKPQVTADFKHRLATSDVQLAVESIRSFGSTRLPLAGLLRECAVTESGEGTQVNFDWAALTMIVNRSGGAKDFLAVVNSELRGQGIDELTPILGAKNLVQELVVQAAITYLEMNQIKVTKDFPGFQNEFPENPLYVEIEGDLVSRSGLTLNQLNELVRKRLQ